MSSNEINYSMGSDARTEASISTDGVEVSSGTTKGYTNEVDESGNRAAVVEDGVPEGATDADELGNEDGPDEPSEGGDDGEVTDIESYDPEDPENVEAWNKEYHREDGSLNIDRISSEFWRNIDRGDEGLNEATYEFLASKGISRADAKRYEAMAINDRDSQKASVEAHDQKLFTLAGGPEALRSALDWGKGGGYSDSQRAKFDAIMNGSDMEAKEEAIELLMGRYTKSDVGLAAEEAAKDQAKPKAPLRDATKGQGGGRPAAKPFKDRSEWRAARREAGDDKAKLRQVDARAKASGF